MIKKTPVTQSFYEYGKIPPQAVELEEAVLGALMLEQNALTLVIDILKPEIFYKENHQIIFSAIHRLFARSQPIDILTVTNELKSKGELEIIGGAYYITQLTNRIASTANVEYHAKIVLQKFIQRELIKISSEIIKDAFEDTTDVFDLLDKAEKNLFAVSENNFRRDYKDMQSLIIDAIKDIQKAKEHEGNLRGIPSGFTELDRVTTGWQKSDLVILAARPGMGKTAFVLSMARNIAVDFKKPIAFFSLEMSCVQLVTRLISSETQLSANKLKRGDLENYEWEQLNAKISNLIEAPLLIDDTPALSIFELRAKCRRLKAHHKIELIIIDYIQLMSSGGENKGNREQEISNISRSLKSLSKELDIPIIALSQLNRSVETRGGSKKPILSDLRESGAIEQDADMVLFIYRPEYYKIDEDEHGNSTKGLAELIIAKHRNGALADIKLNFIDRFAKFTDFEINDFEIPGEIMPNSNIEKATNSYTVQSKMNDMSEDDSPF
ncbi:MAG: replicative DNA helicase [Bacteroidales bacterium]|nr:replicative DNA helicase [Bacteroidales bacterium]